MVESADVVPVVMEDRSCDEKGRVAEAGHACRLRTEHASPWRLRTEHAGSHRGYEPCRPGPGPPGTEPAQNRAGQRPWLTQESRTRGFSESRARWLHPA